MVSACLGYTFCLPPRDSQTRSWRVGDGPNTRKAISFGEGWFIQYPQAKDASTCCNYTDFVRFIKSSWRFRWDIAGFSSHLGHSQPWGAQIERSPWQRCMSPSLHNQREQEKAEQKSPLGNDLRTVKLQTVTMMKLWSKNVRLLSSLWQSHGVLRSPVGTCCKGSGPSWNVWIGIPRPFDKLVFFFGCFMHGRFGCTPWCMWCVNSFGLGGSLSWVCPRVHKILEKKKQEMEALSKLLFKTWISWDTFAWSDQGRRYWDLASTFQRSASQCTKSTLLMVGIVQLPPVCGALLIPVQVINWYLISGQGEGINCSEEGEQVPSWSQSPL